jgi:NYN domain/OST-HTH/LOTUS domain
MSMSRLAVLIDAENAQLAIIGELIGEVAKLGAATVKRAYGDFTTPNLASWREKILAHSIQPVQQFRNIAHKNASDGALIIDAMDLLHSKRLDGFCIVSSDSDFTRLASRIREEGLLVYGFGEKKTPNSFIAACDKFVYTEILRDPSKITKNGTPSTSAPLTATNEIVHHLTSAIQDCADETGWALLGRVGSIINNQLPDFDPRSYGFSKLSQMIKSMGSFEVRVPKNEPQMIAVRVRVARVRQTKTTVNAKDDSSRSVAAGVPR